MKTIGKDQMSQHVGGSLRSFCVGWAAGVGTALSFGWVLGPVGIGAVVAGAALCLAGDTSY